MNKKDVENLAYNLLKEHSLTDYKFEWSTAKKTFGYCNYTTKTISLSKQMAFLNDEKEVKITLLHEIAHALTPNQHHNHIWVKKCLEIGGDGKAKYSQKRIKTVEPKHKYACIQCNTKYERHNKLNLTRIRCGKCYSKLQKIVLTNGNI